MTAAVWSLSMPEARAQCLSAPEHPMTKVRTPEAPTQNLGVISAQPNPVTKVRTSLRTPEGEAPTSLPASTAHTHTFKGVVFYMPDVRLWATIRFLSPPKAVEFDFFLRGSTHTPPKPRTLEAHAHDSGARSTNCPAGAPSGRQMVREVAQPDSDYEGDCPAMVQPCSPATSRRKPGRRCLKRSG